MSWPRRVVPDASVILKWVLDADDEQHRDVAVQLLQDWKASNLELLVPTLWFYEVGNIVCLKRAADAEDILLSLRDLALPEVALDQGLIAETATISVAHKVTFYDAAYVAVARLHGAILVTADAKLVEKLPAEAPVKLLERLATR